jgi:uncharacterized protein
VSVETNKQFVREWFDIIQSADAAERLKDESYIQFIPGELPMAGSWTKDEYLSMMGEVMGENQIQNFSMNIGELVAEGDRVAVEAELFCDLPDGDKYHNWYHFLFIFEDGKLAVLKEYTDMLHIFRKFNGDWIHGPAKERASNVF